MYYVIKSGVFKFLVVLLSLILMMVFIPGSYSFAEDASYGEFPVGHLFCDVNGNIIKAQEINGEAYLFLPASADTTKLKLSFGISTGEELFVSGKSGAPEVKVDGSEVDLDSMSVKDNGVYTLNASERKAGGSEIVNEVIPPAADKAGIDFVFSGHDHSFARTYPMTGGKEAKNVDESKTSYSGDGVIYYICGSTGEKSYSVTDNKDFHFAKATQNYDGAMYLSVEATDDTFKVTTYAGDEVFDTYTKMSDCYFGSHNLKTYDKGKLICSKCGKKFDAESTGYTGEAKDKTTGSNMFFVDGEYQTGFFRHGDDLMLFDNNGMGITKSFKIGDITYSYTNGYYSGCSDPKAGEVEIGFCGADKDGQNLMYAYQKGDEMLNIGLNPLKTDPNGKMKDWTQFRQLPWQTHRYTIETVKINEGVTNVGSFFLQTSVNPSAAELKGVKPALKKVELADTVTSIGRYAFYNTANLSSITMPKNMKSIGDRAFSHDEGIQVKMTGKSVVTAVNSEAFRGCGAKSKLSVPCSSKWIAAISKKAITFPGDIGFYGHAKKYVATKTKAVTRSSKGYKLTYCKRCGDTISKKYFTLSENAGFTSGNVKYRVTLKDKRVAAYAASSGRVTRVSIPSTVSYGGVKYKVGSISRKAFYDCTSLRSIKLGANVAYIGNYAFGKCSKLSSITITRTEIKAANVREHALYGIKYNAVIKVPASSLSYYKKTLKNRGQSRYVTIVKY
jgi:hypothetical protein